MRTLRPNPSIPRTSTISPRAAAVIHIQVADHRPEIVKTGLQRACEHMEARRFFSQSQLLSDAARKHLFSPDVKVRRWTYKLVALLRDDLLLPELRARLVDEQDGENYSWAISAFFRIAPRKEQRQLVRDAWSESFHQSA